MNPKDIRQLPAKSSRKEIDPNQPRLDLWVEKQAEIQGIGMGVLNDGTPFLNQRGLAGICGVQNAHIGTISTEWNEPEQKPRISKIKDLLRAKGVTLALPHMEVQDASGKAMFAYEDTFCIAVLEYYAFEAGANIKEEALKNFRSLAGNALQDFIYAQVGYDPSARVPDAWKHFHDRVSLVYDAVPLGYFCIFKEISDLVVTLIQAGAVMDSHFIPDGSVGGHWATHWKDNNLAVIHGERQQYPHNYPDYFPQARSNPQYPYCYPDGSLPEFRRWFRQDYLTKHFPGYLEGKRRQGTLPPSFVQIAIAAVNREEPKRIA